MKVGGGMSITTPWSRIRWCRAPLILWSLWSLLFLEISQKQFKADGHCNKWDEPVYSMVSLCQAVGQLPFLQGTLHRLIGRG